MALLLGLLAGTASARGPFQPFQLGYWQGGAYTNDPTGRFTHCAAGVGSTSGTGMIVAVNRAHRWPLGFGNPQWTLTPRDQIPVELHFDGGPAVHVVAIALQPGLVEIPMPNNSTLIATFRGASQLSATARGQSFVFDLTGTSRLMPLLTNCVKTALAAEANAMPLAAAPPPAAPTASPTPPAVAPPLTGAVTAEATTREEI